MNVYLMFKLSPKYADLKRREHIRAGETLSIDKLRLHIARPASSGKMDTGDRTIQSWMLYHYFPVRPDRSESQDAPMRFIPPPYRAQFYNLFLDDPKEFASPKAAELQEVVQEFRKIVKLRQEWDGILSDPRYEDAEQVRQKSLAMFRKERIEEARCEFILDPKPFSSLPMIACLSSFNKVVINAQKVFRFAWQYVQEPEGEEGDSGFHEKAITTFYKRIHTTLTGMFDEPDTDAGLPNEFSMALEEPLEQFEAYCEALFAENPEEYNRVARRAFAGICACSKSMDTGRPLLIAPFSALASTYGVQDIQAPVDITFAYTVPNLSALMLNTPTIQTEPDLGLAYVVKAQPKYEQHRRTAPRVTTFRSDPGLVNTLRHV